MKSVNPLNAYKETQIKTANQGKLIVMLYDGAIKNINKAIDALNEGHAKFDSMNAAIIKAQDIITELLVSLDFEKGGDIAKNLFSLYIYMNRQLLQGNINKDIRPFNEVKSMLSKLREAWAEIASKNFDAGAERTNNVNIAG